MEKMSGHASINQQSDGGSKQRWPSFLTLEFWMVSTTIMGPRFSFPETGPRLRILQGRSLQRQKRMPRNHLQ